MADDGRSENMEPVEDPAKRRHLRMAGLAIVATAAGAIAWGLRPKNTESSSEPKLEPPPVPLRRPELAVDPEVNLNRFILKDFTNEEIGKFHRKITNPEYLKMPGMDILDENGNQSEGFKKNVREIDRNYSNYIDQAIETIIGETRFKEVSPAWKDVLRGIIYVESKGQPHPAADDQANHPDRGLCQLKPDAVTDAKKVLRWEDKNDIDLWDAQTNITLALAYLLDLYERFGDPSIAIHAYNNGPKTTTDEIEDLSASYNLKDNSTRQLVAIEKFNILDLKGVKGDKNGKKYGEDILASAFASLKVLRTKA